MKKPSCEPSLIIEQIKTDLSNRQKFKFMRIVIFVMISSLTSIITWIFLDAPPYLTNFQAGIFSAFTIFFIMDYFMLKIEASSRLRAIHKLNEWAGKEKDHPNGTNAEKNQSRACNCKCRD